MTVAAFRPAAFGLRERRARRRSRRPLVTATTPAAKRDRLADLRFFLVAYAAGLAFFLVMLS